METEPTGKNLAGALFGFRNEKTAEVFIEEAEGLSAINFDPTDAETADDWKIPQEIDGVYSVHLRFFSDPGNLSELFDAIQKYGGWLRGALETEPETAAEVIGAVLERGWKPGADEENRPGGLGYDSVQIGIQPALEEDSPDVSEDSEFEAFEVDDSETGDIEVEEEGPAVESKSRKLIPLALGGIILLGALVTWLIVGGDPPVLSFEEAVAESIEKDPAGFSRESMALLLEAAAHLSGRKESDLGEERDSLYLNSILQGSDPSPWNPKGWKLSVDLAPYSNDAWGNPFETRFIRDGDGVVVQMWSRGPNRVNDQGKGDDLAGVPVTLTGAEEVPEEVPIPEKSVEVNLLENVVADSSGAWKMENGTLVSPEDGDYSLAAFSADLPDFYELHFQVARRTGDHGLYIGFGEGRKTGSARIDSPLRKGSEKVRSIGISRILQRYDSETRPLLASGEKKKVILKVTQREIIAGIEGGKEMRLPRGGFDLEVFPPALSESRGKHSIFVGSWNSSFAIEEALLVPSSDDLPKQDISEPDSELKEPEEFPVLPPLEFPREEKVPRKKMISTGWADIRENTLEPSQLGSRGDRSEILVAVAIDLARSELAPSPSEISGFEFEKGSKSPGGKQCEIFRVEDFQIRVDGIVREAEGVVFSTSGSSGSKEDSKVGLGEILIGSVDQESEFERYTTKRFLLYGKDKIIRSGRTRLVIWAKYFDLGEPGPVYLKQKESGDWKRVPDRVINFPAFPVLEKSSK